MAVITLLTDFGNKDYYVSIFKGDLLTACPSANIVDVTHDIPPYDINAAAFFLKNIYRHYPKNTIHIIRVYEQGIENQKILAAKYDNYYFIAPDNGILTLALDSKPDLIVEVDVKQAKYDNLEEYYCRVVKEIIFNQNIGSIGVATNSYVEKRNILPVLEQNSVNGRVIYIDNFGNIITNIKVEDIERYNVDKENIKIEYRKEEFISKIVKNYADVPQGYAIGRFNSIGYLEISIHCGNASQLLGLDLNSALKIWVK
jgi:S-adenosylmethionine hydrolase